MVRRDHLVAEALAEQVGDPLGHATGVDEHQRGAVSLHVGGDAVEDVVELLARGDRTQLVVGQLDGQIEPAAVADVDHRTARPSLAVVAIGSRADEEPGDGLDRPLGGRQADPARPAIAQLGQTLQGESQVRAPLVARHRVDLVDDHRLHRCQGGPAAFRGHQKVERLGCRDEEVGRMAEQGGPGRCRGVTVADLGPKRRRPQAHGHRHLGDLGQGGLEVLADVNRQRLERRDVHHLGGALDGLPALGRPVQLVDADEEAGQGLARAGGGRDERVVAGRHLWPAEFLGWRRPVRKPSLEPCPHGRVEAGQPGGRRPGR